MNGMGLDQKLRAVLLTVTRETCLSATQAIVNLRFGAPEAYAVVSATLHAQEKGKRPRG